MTDNLLDKGQRDRSHIAMGQPHEVQYWTRHLGVTKEELQRSVDKVGNSVAAVRKELGLLGEPHR
jgi:3-oxoacyl-[acyl-carrier-protein] synthase III